MGEKQGRKQETSVKTFEVGTNWNTLKCSLLMRMRLIWCTGWCEFPFNLQHRRITGPRLPGELHFIKYTTQLRIEIENEGFFFLFPNKMFIFIYLFIFAKWLLGWRK